MLDKVFDGFWMKTAYRIPDNDCACIEPGTAPKATVPINRFNVRSFITNVADGAKVQAGGTDLQGHRLRRRQRHQGVDGLDRRRRELEPARLGKDLGKYSFREWRLPVKLAAGAHVLKVRATNNDGKTQPDEAAWNPPGYMRNVVEIDPRDGA